MKALKSYEELKAILSQDKKALVLLYKKGSEQCDCAYSNLKFVADNSDQTGFYSADVTTVRDIHANFGVSSAPSLLEFESGELKNIYKGCYQRDQLLGIVNRQTAVVKTNGQKPAKNVVVYSTPTCSWCTTLKNYLRDNNIRFRDVDVSRNEKLAQEMVRKSGQQGVPQTEINGQIIVGFDRERINRLLEINN